MVYLGRPQPYPKSGIISQRVSPSDLVQDLEDDNPFCFPCCGYYCDEGAYCPCSKCWKENQSMREELERSDEDE